MFSLSCIVGWNCTECCAYVSKYLYSAIIMASQSQEKLGLYMLLEYAPFHFITRDYQEYAVYVEWDCGLLGILYGYVGLH